MDFARLLPERIKLLYLFLAVLLLVGMVPLYIFGTKVVDDSRERLKDSERLQQNNITRTLADEIKERHRGLHIMMNSLAASIQVNTGGNLTGKKIDTPELHALITDFVNQNETIAFAILLNTDVKGPSASRIPLDDFMRRELEHAFQAAKERRDYHGQTLSVGSGKNQHAVRLHAIPIAAGGQFIGMLAAFVDMQFLTDRLNDVSQGGLQSYVVDSSGRLVASADKVMSDNIGQDMSSNE